ncbi:MAG: DUF1499 domain-containing protein [Sulfuricaulis sp.]
MIYWFLGLVIILCLLFVGLSIHSRNRPELGLLDGRLRRCPSTPNCVCSEDQGKPSYIKPLSIKDNSQRSWEKIKRAIRDMGGNIDTDRDGYLRATFTTRIFRFKDDLELRMDEQNRIIQVRSASRVGRSDLGTNRRRVENLRARFDQMP